MGDGIKQGNELRRAAQEAILALFNLNTPQVTVRLANLPQEYQVNDDHSRYTLRVTSSFLRSLLKSTWVCFDIISMRLYDIVTKFALSS